MCGWFMAAMARASRSNRWVASVRSATFAGSTLMAIVRFSRVSFAR